MEEKRNFGRVSFVTAVHLDAEGLRFEGELLDISLKGALVRVDSNAGLSLGMACHLVIELANGDIALDFSAETAHLHEDCVGFRFTASDPDSFSHLRRLLELNTGDPERVERELHQMFRPH